MIELDGSYGEGGGALIRVALALSTLTGQEFKVTKIRANRPDSGLKAQHLEAINALKQICKAETNEIKLGTNELWYKPGKLKSGIYEIDIGTAGSITLLLQALLLPCLFAPAKVTLKITGGTCGKWQASVDYLQNVLLPHLQKFVESIELKIFKRGYYPKGGGAISLEIRPRFKLKEHSNFNEFWKELQSKVQKITLTQQGTLEQIRGIINLSAELEEKKIGERIKNSAEASLREYSAPKNIRIEHAPSFSIGGEILLWALFGENGNVNQDNPVILGSDVLLEKNKSSEEIGKEAAEKLRKEFKSGAAVDHYLADQLIPFMALLPGSEIVAGDISEHARTNMAVCEQFLPVKFEVAGNRISVEHR